jgi:hypothetical protein
MPSIVQRDDTFLRGSGHVRPRMRAAMRSAVCSTSDGGKRPGDVDPTCPAGQRHGQGHINRVPMAAIHLGVRIQDIRLGGIEG